jgi:hypothetical protein
MGIATADECVALAKQRQADERVAIDSAGETRFIT